MVKCGLFIVLLLVSVGCNFGKTGKELYDAGIKKVKAGDREQGFKLLKKAVKKEKKNSKYAWAAANVAPDQNETYIFTKSAWDNGLKNPIVLLRLTAVAFHTTIDQKLKYALNLYTELPDSFRTPAFKGDIFYNFQQYDSALALWKPIEKKKPNPAIINKIAQCYQKKGDFSTLKEFLEENREKGLLNSRGYMLLANTWQRDYNYAMVDTVFYLAETDKKLSHAYKTEYASSLVFQNRLPKAQNLLREVVRSDSLPSSLKLYASTLLSYSYFLAKDELSLNRTLHTADTTRKSDKLLFFLNTVLLKELSEDTTGNFNRIRKLHSLSPSDPVITLLFAKMLIREKKFSNADSVFRRLPSGLFFSPPVIVDVAAVKAALGKDNDAIALISRMHKNRVFNKKSLELFRDITFKKKLFDKASAAQKLLEAKFRDDVKLRYSGALMALKKGAIDSAIILFSKLAKEYPDEEQFEFMRISSMLLKEDFQGVISACSTSSLPDATKKVLEARAWRKLNNTENALQAYEAALARQKKNVILTRLEYAEFLTEVGNNKKAAELFSGLLKQHEQKSELDSTYLAAILNNFAWTAMNSGQHDENTVLEAAKKALDLQPENTHILDTYASALIKFNGFKKCVKLLQKNENTREEPRLLVHLGEAYEKTGDNQKAAKAYQDALAIPDSSAQLPLSINRNKLKKHVESLLESN